MPKPCMACFLAVLSIVTTRLTFLSPEIAELEAKIISFIKIKRLNMFPYTRLTYIMHVLMFILKVFIL